MGSKILPTEAVAIRLASIVVHAEEYIGPGTDADLNALESQLPTDEEPFLDIGDLDAGDLRALIAELRAARKVVEAVREWRDGGIEGDLARALAELEALK